ncbi:DUF3306 domain-containing protein [Kaarinaea lacus]
MKQSKEPSLDQPVQNTETQEPFLRRWSKRKLDSAQVQEDDSDNADNVSPGGDAQSAQGVDAELVEKPQHTQPELTDDDMPPLETLDEHSDFSMFLSPKVSETLRRRALQKLFHFQQFNITDGLNDYDDDYTHFETLGDIIPHDMKRVLQREAEKSPASSDDAQQEIDNETEKADELEPEHSSDAVAVAEEETGVSNTEVSNTEEDQASSVVLSHHHTTNS